MWTYRRLLLSIASFSLLTLIGSTDAFASPELRVAYVDVQRALAESSAGLSAKKQYEQEVAKAQKGLDRKKAEFEKRRDDFGKQKDSLSETAYQQREEELIKLEKDLKRSFQDSQEALRRKNAQMVGELVREIRKAVSEVGQKEGFTIILEKGSQAVLYADNSIDITDSVVKQFNKSMSK